MYSVSRHGGVMALLALGLALGGCNSADVNAKPPTSPSPQGANPAAWVGAFCGGLGDVVAAAAALNTQPTSSQRQKDALLKVADTTQQAFTGTANKLSQLGSPAVGNGKQIQNDAISFFTTTAATLSNQRAKLAALDTNDPNFIQKANQLTNPGDNATAQLQKVTSNSALQTSFGKAPECQRLLASPAPTH